MNTFGHYFAARKAVWDSPQIAVEMDEAIGFLVEAMHVARRYGDWEGDIPNDELYISGLPDPDSETKLLWRGSRITTRLHS